KKFLGSDYRLGPEIRSTGEVLGHAASFGHAFAKAESAAGTPLPTEGAVLITVNDFDKAAVVKIARDLHRMGFRLYATRGTADWLARVGLPVTPVKKVSEGHPNIQDMVENGELQLIINTPLGARAHDDSRTMRTAAVLHNVPLMTTLSAAAAAVNGIAALRARELSVTSLQAHYARNRRDTSRS
ncbi:MAG: carbamoyl-phosphate synthase large subunit, partial [Anaerolineae bacterium]